MDIQEAAVRKLAELKKITTERAAKNPARYEKFSDRIKELIDKFNAGLLEAQETLDMAKKVAEGVATEDQAHRGTGLNERAFSIHAILEKFKPAEPPVAAEGEGEYNAGGETPEPKLSAMQEVAKAIDELYASDESAPPHWQDKAQMKKGLRSAVRKLVRTLDLPGWKKDIPTEVEHYAVLHYSKP